jgi:hypothetical protein
VAEKGNPTVVKALKLSEKKFNWSQQSIVELSIFVSLDVALLNCLSSYPSCFCPLPLSTVSIVVSFPLFAALWFITWRFL